MGGSGGSSDHGAAGRGGGGGGGGGGMPRGRGGGSKFDCDNFVATVMLTSVKPAVIAELTIDDVLWIQLTDGGEPVVAVDSEDQVAGSIVIIELDDLIKCIKAGTEYEARVKSIEGGACIIELYAVE